MRINAHLLCNLLACFWNWQTEFGACALSHHRNHPKMTAQLAYSFIHTDQTQAIAPGRSSVESAAVVRNGSNHPFARSLQRHFNFMRARMFGYVRQGLLNHSVET